MVAVQDPKGPTRSPPKMEQFREQIDLYEGLYLEIEEMEPSKVFCGWFRVDLRPFRQSVLNMVCKWSSMFKRHLVDRVTSSLSDLGSFIRCFSFTSHPLLRYFPTNEARTAQLHFSSTDERTKVCSSRSNQAIMLDWLA